MKGLLQTSEKKEYPTEYLMARLAGRKAHLLKDWEGLLMHACPSEMLAGTPYGEFMSSSSEGAWRRALKEFHWVYNQMNDELRDVFGPFFTYLELRTLLICLRHRMSKKHESVNANILYYSLLSEGVKRILTEGPDVPSIIIRLEKTVFTADLKNRRLEEVFSAEGLKGLEEKFTAAVLEGIAFSGLHPCLKKFFTYLIDSRNVIGVYKHLKWNVPDKPVLADGGKVRRPVLSAMLDIGEISGILSLAGRLAGAGIAEMATANMERILLTELTKQVKSMGRASDTGFILQYLWSTYIEARNVGIILSCGEIEREVLKEELVVS